MRTAVRSAGLRLLSVLVLGLVAAGLAGCGSAEPDNYALVVNVDGLPADAAKLIVDAQLDGKPSSTQPLTVMTKLTRFGVRLPKTTQGTLTLSIDVRDAQDCKLGNATLMQALSGGYRDELRATVSPFAMKDCGAPPACAPGILCWSTPKPQGNAIKSMWTVAPNDVWAVGDVGLLLHYDGSSWKKVSLGLTEGLNGIWGTSASNLWIVGDKGKILHYDGAAWTVDTTSGTTRDLSAVFGFSADDVWAVGSSGTALRRLKGAAGWLPAITSTTNWLYGLWARAANEVYAVGEGGIILKHDGSGWTRMTNMNTQHLLSVWGSGAKTYAVGFGGTILELVGTTWTAVTSNTTNALLSIFSPSAGKFVVVGEAATLLRSTGAAFTKDNGINSLANLFTVRGTGDNDLWAGGSGGKLLHFDGTMWTSQSTAPERGLRSVYAVSAKDIWAVGESGTALHYDGTSWMTTNSTVSVNLNAVFALSPTEVFAVGDGSTFIRWNGTRWARDQDTPTLWKDTRGVWADGPGNIWVVATSSNMTQNLPIFSRYDGSGWFENVAVSGAPNSVNAVWGNGMLLYMAGNGYLAIVNTASKSGTVYTTNQEMYGIHGTSSSNVLAVGAGGVILRWSGAAPWEQQANLMTANNLYGVFTSGTMGAWVVGDSGTLLRLNGTKWTLPETGTRNNLRGVHGVSDADVWVAGSAGSVLHSLP
jgi:hypothetical protein